MPPIMMQPFTLWSMSILDWDNLIRIHQLFTINIMLHCLLNFWDTKVYFQQKQKFKCVEKCLVINISNLLPPVNPASCPRHYTILPRNLEIKTAYFPKILACWLRYYYWSECLWAVWGSGAGQCSVWVMFTNCNRPQCVGGAMRSAIVTWNHMILGLGNVI